MVILFSSGVNLEKSNPNPEKPTSFITGYDIAEIVCLFLFLINNSVVAYYEAKMVTFLITQNFFIVACIIMPLTLFILKLIINSLNLEDAKKLIIVNGCFRLVVLYLSMLYNVMDINNVLPLIVTPSDWKVQESSLPNVEEERKRDKDCESNNLVKQPQATSPILSPKRNSFLNENSGSNNRFPILLQGKVKLPIFISFDVTSENGEKGSKPDENFMEELSILYDHEKINNINLQDKYSDLITELNKINDIDFNVFNVSSYSNELELLVLMNHLFRLYNFKEVLRIDSTLFKNYFYLVNISYRKNPYHNSIHATDVVQTFYFFIKTCNIETTCNLSELELFSLFFAGAIHDLDHPGNNNNYEIAVQSNLALSYNDKAVLENYHLVKAFSILKRQEANVFEGFNRQDYSRSRAMIINSVLATDMAVHFSELTNLKNRIKAPDFNPQTTDKDMLMNQLIHACDISNPTKPFEIYQLWVDRVITEFFNQGDKEREKGLKVSFMCDRHTTNIPQTQIGFIDGIVAPLYEGLAMCFNNLKMINNMISSNKEKYKQIRDEQVATTIGG